MSAWPAPETSFSTCTPFFSGAHTDATFRAEDVPRNHPLRAAAGP